MNNSFSHRHPFATGYRRENTSTLQDKKRLKALNNRVLQILKGRKMHLD